MALPPEIFEWILLLTRWLHITVGITWIGTSIFFMWLDRTLQINEKSSTPGHAGEVWMVHGGGFYHVEKRLMGPTKVPEQLHWFKWESYWTFISGVFLLWLMFYASGGALLLDSSSSVSYGFALATGLSSIVLSWIFYDQLWESGFAKNHVAVGNFLTLLWFGGATYVLCSILSGRAAYMHVGAMVGTWMTGNVFLRIIPRQVKMVEAAKSGTPVNQEWSKNAKYRSTHNTYFTLPIIFIMLSNHFPTTYGSGLNWLVLLVVSAAGAFIRHFFLIRLSFPQKAKGYLLAGISLIAVAIFMTKESL